MAELWYPGALKHDMRPVTSTFWAKRSPQNVLHHQTGGEGNPLWPGGERFHVPGDGVGTPFGIRRDGTVCQYVPAEMATWHAYSESHYGIGIELASNPTQSSKYPVLVVQLEAGAKLVAWLCKVFGIPAIRCAGVSYGPGLKCHTDGLQNKNIWDPNGHYDAWTKCAGDPIDAWVSSGERVGLNRSPWSWSDYIARLKNLINPPPPGGGPMDDADAKKLGYDTVGDWRIQEERSKAVSDVLADRAKRTGQDPAYGEQYDATKATLKL